MYAQHFGLTQDPFSIAPDPRYLFMSERHREALAHLLYGLDAGGGFVLQPSKRHVLLGDETTLGVFTCLAGSAPGICEGAIEVESGAQDWPRQAGLALPVRADTGQARKLGVVGTPALFLMRPPDVILPLAQGALDLDTLTARIVDQAHAAGWVDDAAYAATRAVRQPFAVPEPDSLATADLSHPARIVTSLRRQLGLPAALTPDLSEGDLP